jgi:Rps23 Pro-64 3,4-dihydroxylase Tpa1-like proline 4-hydroxylase
MEENKLNSKFENEELLEFIIERLTKNLEQIKAEFESSRSNLEVRFVAIDNFLPENIALEIYNSFSKQDDAWREMNSFREKKLTSKKFDDMPKLLGEITFAIQHPRVIKLVEKIVGMEFLVADPSLYAGGLSMMRSGDFLNPHIDNSHEQSRSMYRRLNLLYYVSPNWDLECGGNLELWDKKVENKVTIVSSFNRLVLMETNHYSWHSVSPVKGAQKHRCCVSNYYFSKNSPLNHDYYHVTSFQGRPDQFIRRVICRFDNILRNSIRLIKKDGLGKKDVYRLK